MGCDGCLTNGNSRRGSDIAWELKAPPSGERVGAACRGGNGREPASGRHYRYPACQPRGLVGLSWLPKKIAFNSRRSVPCQYLRCAGSSANSTTLPCPCGDTTSHAAPATRLRLRSER